MMMNNRPGDRTPRFDKMEHFMKKEIGFSKSQIDSFRLSRKANSEAMQYLNMEIHKKKKQLMDGAFDESLNEDESQKLIREIADLQTKVEEISQKHLMEMSRLCRPDQKEKLKHLLEEAMVKHRPDFHDRDQWHKGVNRNKKEDGDHKKIKPNRETH
ncbi:MAG: hypothetical protein K9H62_05510 [Bacteroidales bacterium]|nr:hypothetical protein [Bacteroidales bacterium]